MPKWTEVGDRVFVRRYEFFDQNIGVILGEDAAMLIDTRSTHAQAREIHDDLRELTRDPVTVVVDTHGHFDHAFGNHVFRPAAIWGHTRCVTFLERTGEARRARIAKEEPELAADLDEVVIDPPDRTFDETGNPVNPVAEVSLGIALDDLEWWTDALKVARAKGQLPPAVFRIQAAAAAVDEVEDEAV